MDLRRGNHARASLIAFYNDMTAVWMSGQQWMFLILTFDTVLHIVPTEKLMNYGLDKQTVSQTENWLTRQV